MPATHLTSVDLPAPLSPTSAITSPARAWKSTPRSACTAPKCLCTPRSSKSGCSLTVSVSCPSLGGAPVAAPLPIWLALGEPCRLAVGRELPGADVAGLEETVLDDRVLDVGLGDGDRLEQ